MAKVELKTAQCMKCSADLVVDVDYPTAREAAEHHTRMTGHPTRVT